MKYLDTLVFVHSPGLLKKLASFVYSELKLSASISPRVEEKRDNSVD